METTGKIVSVATDFMSGKLHITFEIDTKPFEDINVLSKVEKLDVISKIHRNKRSLDANAYFHVLVGKIADKINVSKTYCKNLLIGRYGQQEFLDNSVPVIIKTNIPVDQMMEQEMLHTVPCGNKIENGSETVFYKVFRGSHTYDTKEMSVLIRGTVDEAKDLGIETMTPAELQTLLNKWRGKS